MKKVLITFVLTFICLINDAYSQTKTPYEKKVDQIMTEMCKAIGVDNSLLQMAIKLDDWDIVRTSQDFAFKTKMMDKNELIVVILATEQKLKEAEKLKNDVDRKKDADKKAKEDRDKKIAEENALKEKQAIEEKKRQEELKIENEARERKKLQLQQQEEAEKLYRYNTSDYVSIINQVSSEFNSWLVKGEFEKSEIYAVRMSDNELIFDSICNKIIANKREQYHSSRITLNAYNPDSETFPVVIKLGDNYSFADTLSVNIADAEKFKNLSYNRIKLPTSEADWFLFDYNLYPKKIFINNVEGKDPIVVNVPLASKAAKLKFSTREMKLTNYNGQEIIYDYETYLIKKEELIKAQRKRKYDEFVNKAISSEENGNLADAIANYKNALSIEKESQNLKDKIALLTEKLNELNRSKLITEAEEFNKNGQLSKSKQKYLEANKIRISSDVTDLISSLEKSITESKQKHSDLTSQFNLAASSKDLPKYSKMNEDLENVKEGFGSKYNTCVDSINLRLNRKKSNLNTKHEVYLKNLNREIWSSENQDLFDLIISYNDEYKDLKKFEDNIYKALQNDDKKYLKILKEDNAETIIETVIKEVYQ